MTKIPQIRCLVQENLNFSQFWRMGRPRSRFWKVWCLMRTCILIHMHLPVAFSHGSWDTELSGASIIRALTQFMSAPSSWLITFQRPWSWRQMGLRLSSWGLSPGHRYSKKKIITGLKWSWTLPRKEMNGPHIYYSWDQGDLPNFTCAERLLGGQKGRERYHAVGDANLS